MNFIRKSALSSATCLQSAALAAALIGIASASTAQAQAADPAPAAAEECADTNTNGVCDKDEGKDIVVTGSRLTRPTLSSPVPLTSITPGELSDGGDVSLGDALNDLPSLRSTFSSGNSTRFIGTAGLNILDLRGLGTSRTLVLVNGKRHITASPGDYLVDVNTIPVDLLERVDIVTGGNSAIYGSDAVAGVVNFILKRDFDGLALRGQGGISSHHDRGAYFVSGTYGKNFADGRGNIAVSGEYARQNPLYFRDRDDITGAFSGRCQLQVIEPTGGEPFGTDGIIDNQFLCGVRNAALSDGGTTGALDPATSSTRRYLRFAPNGNLVVDTPTLSFAPVGSGNQIGGFGSTLRNTGIMAAGVERYDANVLFHYDFSDAVRLYGEAKYVRVNANQEGQPSFFQGGQLGTFSCNNPFLNAQARSALVTSGATLNAVGTECALKSRTTVASPGVPIGTATAFILDGNGNRQFDPTRSFSSSRFNIDFGGRGELHKRDTYRAVVGVEGTFNDDWHYDLSVNYGRLNTKLRSLNNLKLFDINGNLDGYLLAKDAVLAPAGFTGSNFVLNSTGQKVVCQVNGTTNARPDCVPINTFGDGAPSAAALAFVNTEGARVERAEEFQAAFSLAGDLSQLFSLPGGPIGFAIGAEYREEIAHSSFDALTASGGTFLNAIQPFNPPKLTIKEAYGEIDLPLLKDVPGAKELTVRAAGRVSDYNTRTGTVYAYNIDGIYAPIEDVRFRIAYATSVRAPTQSDLFSPQSQNFAFIADPCDSSNITAGPNRTANCAAAGVPTTYTPAVTAACSSTSFTGSPGAPYRNCLALSSSTGFTSGGNPTLFAERGKSLTFGMVLEPHWIPGLNFTVDYYKITVTNLIATLGAQTIINLCYDSPSGINNPFCATVNRDPNTGLFVQPAVISGGVNFAKQKTEGVDFDLSYRRTFSNGHKVAFRAIATRVAVLDNYVDPTLPQLPNRQLGELGDPLWAANASLNYDFGPVDFTYTARYIGKQSIGTYEAQHTYTGICPSNGIIGFSGGVCTPGQLAQLDPQNNDLTAEVNYPGVIYHNVRVNFSIEDNKFNFYVGIDNLMDKKPPLGLLGVAGGDPYDTYGRFMYAGFKANF